MNMFGGCYQLGVAIAGVGVSAGDGEAKPNIMYKTRRFQRG